MRIVRVDRPLGAVMAVLDGDGAVRLTGARHSTELVAALVAGGTAGETGEVVSAPALLSPVSDPGKIIAVGLNYVDHAAETGRPLPDEPVIFTKFRSSIVGPGAAVRWSRRVTDGVDYEAELGVVIGRPARDVTPGEALSHVFGYTCLNDVSARDLQYSNGGQWVRAKSLDTFCPIGPWITTADEVPDPQALRISCTIGDETLQSASTADMIFTVADLVSRLSRLFTLETGDVIATGTPPGVGWHRTPRRVLRHGDEVTVRIEGVGELRNPVVVTD